MSIGICNLCCRKDCKNGLKFDSTLTECSAFIDDDNIDWEQRRYEIAKDIVASLLQRSGSAMCTSVDNAMRITDELIMRLKEK